MIFLYNYVRGLHDILSNTRREIGTNYKNIILSSSFSKTSRSFVFVTRVNATLRAYYYYKSESKKNILIYNTYVLEIENL